MLPNRPPGPKVLLVRGTACLVNVLILFPQGCHSISIAKIDESLLLRSITLYFTLNEKVCYIYLLTTLAHSDSLSANRFVFSA